MKWGYSFGYTPFRRLVLILVIISGPSLILSPGRTSWSLNRSRSLVSRLGLWLVRSFQEKIMDFKKNWALVEGLHSCREILLAYPDHIVIGMHSGEYDNGRVEYPFQVLTNWDLDGCALVKIPMKYVRAFMTLGEVESYYRNRDFFEATWAQAS